MKGKYNLNAMDAYQITDALLDKEKRDEFLRDVLEDSDNYNEAVDAIVNRIRPIPSLESPLINYPEYINLIHTYEKYIDGKDWNEREVTDFDLDFYSYAFYGIRGYIEKNMGLQKLIH